MSLFIDLDAPPPPSAEIAIKNNKCYWPSGNWLVWCTRDEEEEFFIGVEAWLQFVYDNNSPTHMPQRPLFGYDENQARWKFWSILSHHYNQKKFKLHFKEID
jgi:hypothetical protein